MKLLRSILFWPFRNWWRAIPTVLLLALCVWGVFFVKRRDRLRAQKAEILAGIRARGDVAEFRDYAKLVRTDDPGLKHLCRAILSVGGETAGGYSRRMTRSPYREIETLIGDWKKPDDPPVPADWTYFESLKEPAADPKLAALVKKLGPALAELEEGCKHPAKVFPHDFHAESPYSILLPHIQDMRALARACRAANMQAIVNGDPRKAFHYVLLGINLAHRMEPEVFLISKLVEIAIFKVACESLAFTLAYFDPTPEEFAALDAALLAAERFSYRECMVSEQAVAVQTLDHLKMEEVLPLSGMRGGDAKEWRLRILAYYESSWLGEPDRLEDQIWLFSNLDQRTRAIDDLGPAGEEALKTYDAELAERKNASLLGFLMPSISNLRTAKHRHLVTAHLARGCLRAHRYLRQHGKLPDKIADFADSSWPPSSEDYFGPSGPRYEKTADGFTLRHPDQSLGRGAPVNPYSLEVKYPPAKRPK
ncbi:MAG TPA: hypothetical protein VNC50_06305 [Planctomycetia bacterium]|nr:hypothetical protein [Planctomycetia bacterium]